MVLAVGEPAGWVADRLPFDEWTDDALAFLEDDGVGDEGGFDAAPSRGAAAACRRCRPTRSTRPSSAPSPSAAAELDTLLVTGDSLAMPLDVELARRLAERTRTSRSSATRTSAPGISKTGLLDWGKLSTEQVARATSPTPWWCSSAPTRASRCPGAGRRADRVLRRRTGPRRTPTACAG